MGERALLALPFIGILLLVAGCAIFPPEPESQITGYVTNSGSGEPVSGSRVFLHGLTTNFSTVTMTDSRGQFKVRVPPDRYEIQLSKPGYAGSWVIGLNAQTPTEIRIIQREVFNPRWSTRPPRLELRGVGDGDRFQGEIKYRVEASGENDIQFIYVALGKTPGSAFLTAPRQIFQETPTTGDQTLDPAAFGARGQTTFEVVVYDMNGNRTHLIREITVVPPEGPVNPPQELRAIAVTLGQQIGFFGIDKQAAPARANLYVELSWRPSGADLTGYRVYRSFDGESFQPIAQLGAGQRFYTDSDAALAVGRRVYYRVTALRGGDESEPSNTASTRPLEAFDVRLISPADEARNIPRTPTFRWEPTRKVGRYQIYGVVLWDTVLGDAAFWVTPEPPQFLINRTSWRWNEDGRMTATPWETLQPNRIYEWEVAYALSVDDLENPTAVSVAANRLGLENEKIPIRAIGIPATQNFSFTTRD